MIKQIKTDLELLLKFKPNRLQHIYGVKDTAISLGKKYNLDLKKLELASLLHDITKYYSYEYNVEVIKKNYKNHEEILSEFNKATLHAFSAAVVAKEKYNIDDEDVINAIISHTVGKPKMNLYEQILFISDYIEPTRKYDSCIKVRKIAEYSLDKATYEAINDSIILYEGMNQMIPKTAYQARIYYKDLTEE